MYECMCAKEIIGSVSSRTFSNSFFTNNVFMSAKDGDVSYKTISFVSTNYANIKYPYLEQQAFLIKKRKNNNDIVLLYINNISNEKKTDFTLLFSHDNRTSLGMIYPTLFDLSSSLKCDVISYDYSGYGCSTGTPSETEITDDIVHVMSFCSNIIHIPFSKLILFGHSIGTIPTIHVSSLNRFRDLGGVVLISPSSTGSINDYKEDNKTKRRKLSTVNSNYNVNDIACPVFLIHGQKDNIIPVSHSHELSEEIKYSGKSYCWFPKKGTHYNIMYDLRRKFYRKFMYFLDLIERFHKQINENLMFKSDLNIKPISHISNVSIGKPREENYIANTNQYNDNNNNKELESSSFEGNNSSNFIVMNEPEKITAPAMMNVNEHK